MPSKYHYEYIPVARENLDRLAKLHGFGMTWTSTDLFGGLPEIVRPPLPALPSVSYVLHKRERLAPALTHLCNLISERVQEMNAPDFQVD